MKGLININNKNSIQTRRFLLCIPVPYNPMDFDLYTAERKIVQTFDCLAILISLNNECNSVLFGIVCRSSDKSTVLAEKAKSLFQDYPCEVHFFKGLGSLCTYFASCEQFTTSGLYSQEEIYVRCNPTKECVVSVLISRIHIQRQRNDIFSVVTGLLGT